MIKRILITLLFKTILIGQNLFDPYDVHTMDILFYNPNYDQILQDRWEIDDKTYELANIIFNDETMDSVGVRYKGNSTFFMAQAYGIPKFPLNIDIDLVQDDQNLLGYNKVKLSNSLFDPTYVKETIGYLTEGYYLPTPESGYLNISVNGDLLGLYVSVESVNKPFLTKHFGNNEGVFIKCEPQFHFGEPYYAWPDLVWYGSDSSAYAYQKGYELKSDSGWGELLDLIYTLNFDINNIENILNVDRALWYFAASTVMPDLDTYNGMYIHNFYLYRNTNSGQFEIIPWDKDNTFGGAMINTIIEQGGSPNTIYNWDPFYFENDELRPLFSQLMTVPLYKKIYSAHIRTIITEIYNVDYFHDLAYGIQDNIEIYADNDPNLFLPFTFGDYFQFNVDNYLSTFGGGYWCGITSTISPRLDYLLSHSDISQTAPVIYNVVQENDAPVWGEDVIIQAEVEGAVSVELMVTINSSPSHFISIPMYDDGYHGDADADDFIYGATVPFQEYEDHVKYFVRASNEDALILSPEKAENEFYEYTVSHGGSSGNSLVINEINYNSSDNFDSEDWVELYNPTDDTFNISNWEFKDENDNNIFYIPENIFLTPGQYIVLCKDTTSFVTIFDDVENYIGNIDFGFSGNGELLRLFNSSGELVDFVEYDDSEPWPIEPDGNGPTLELINPFLDNSIANNWNASEDYGTPGYINGAYDLELGDLNEDNSIDILDVVLMVGIILGNDPIGSQEWSSDINGDGFIDVLDVVQLVNIILYN